MKVEAQAIEIVDQLQAWLEDRDGLCHIPVANLCYSRDVMTIQIDDIAIWDNQDINDSEREGYYGLSLEWCKEKWLEYIESLTPFLTELTPAQREGAERE